MKHLMFCQVLHHLFQRPLIRALRSACSAALEQHGEVFKADALFPVADAPAGHANRVALFQQRLFPKAEPFKSLLHPFGFDPAPKDGGIIPAVVLTDVGIAFMDISVGISFRARIEFRPTAILDRRGKINTLE